MRASLALIIAVALAMMSSCGEDDGTTADPPAKAFRVRASTTMETGPLAKSQFVARVNRLCRHAWPVVLKDFAANTAYDAGQRSRLDRSTLYARSVRRSFLAGLDLYVFDQIRNLKAPEAEGGKVEEVIGKMQIAVERGWRGHPAHSPIQLGIQFANYNQAAISYGLADCLVDGPHIPPVLATRSPAGA